MLCRLPLVGSVSLTSGFACAGSRSGSERAQLRVIFEGELIDQPVDQVDGRDRVETVEIPAPVSDDGACEGWLSDPADGVAVHLERVAVDVPGRVGTEPYHERRDLVGG